MIAAVIGAVVGSLGGAYLGVVVGADRDDERADREFWRTQRIAVYGELLAAAEDSRSLILDASSIPEVGDGIRLTVAKYDNPSRQSLLDVRESMKRVNSLVGQISFLSEDVAPLAEALRDELQGAQTFIQLIGYCHTEAGDDFPCTVTPDKVSLPDAEDEWWSLGQFESDYDNFMQAAQEQLDAPE